MSPSSRNPLISNSISSGGVQCKGSLVHDTDDNLQITNVYRAKRQLKGVIKGGLVRHDAMLFETTDQDKKYGIVEWMGDSQVYSYFLTDPRIYQKNKKDRELNRMNDGQCIWTIKKQRFGFQTLKDIKDKVQHILNNFNKYNLFKNNCQQFVCRMLDQAYEKVTWYNALISVAFVVGAYALVVLIIALVTASSAVTIVALGGVAWLAIEELIKLKKKS